MNKQLSLSRIQFAIVRNGAYLDPTIENAHEIKFILTNKYLNNPHKISTLTELINNTDINFCLTSHKKVNIKKWQIQKLVDKLNT